MAFRQYNPNPDGKRVGDCTIRAISADDAAVSAVSSKFPRRPEARSSKAAAIWKNEPAAAKPATSYGTTVSNIYEVGSNRAHGEQYIRYLKGVST